MKLKYIGCFLVGVAVGHYLAEHYEFEVNVEHKDTDDAE